MKTIILYGELAKRFGKHHRFSVSTVSEAIRALRANFKGFENFLATAHHNGMGFKVFVGGHSLDINEVPAPLGKSNNIIRIAPAVIGSGNAWTRIILGVALIAVGVISRTPNLVLAGAALAFGGVAQLLTKTPKIGTGTREESQSTESYIFSGPQNVTAQGNAIPLVYGRMMVGSAIISAGIDVNEE